MLVRSSLNDCTAKVVILYEFANDFVRFIKRSALNRDTLARRRSRMHSQPSPTLRIQHFVLGALALVLGDDLLHDLDDGHVVEGVGGFEETGFVGAGFLVVVLADGGDHDLGMVGGLGLLGIVEDLFVELLAIAEAGELYLHVLGTGELDHALGEVDDADGSAHIEDEDLAALAHGAGLEDELAGFGDEHEEADDVGMGDGDGTALADLLLEDGDDGAVAAEDIAEAGGDELGDALDTPLDNGLVERLAVDLADALAAPHDIGGVDGLVGGDHHELAGAVLDGEVGNHARTIYIVLHGNAGVVFHHGDVLIGSGMEDVVGVVGSEDALHVPGIGDAADDGLALDIGEATGHHETYVVHGGLGLVDENHRGGTEEGYLTYHLGTDGACSTGDKDDLTTELGSDGIQIDLYLLARQKVFDIDLAEVAVGELGTTVPLLGGGHHHHLDTCGEEGIDHGGVLTEELALEGRHEEGLDTEPLHGIGNALAIGVDLLAHQRSVLHLIGIGDEGYEAILLVLDGGDAIGKADTTGLGTVDGYGSGIVDTEIVEQALHEEALEPHQKGGYQEGDGDTQDIGHKQHRRGEQPRDQHHKQRTDHGGKHDMIKVYKRGVTYDARVGTEHTERNYKQQHRNQGASRDKRQ